ncbi:Glutathione S-transferase kappa 1 [Hondaea fermentalgiana]|uniref:Glutathione S-transferase kappa n=1 Tax=Hondaea fermentalgiana TaxID=2315210 RepID=A0A2R5GBR0_9STRA|nr:Glutathione S-transferase kappa 1 [Hondaea fermentalgiana]|eukprot:GBG25551.1 Glutathione S-transferase kappa 1 [Hondaea fermentalgiana]
MRIEYFFDVISPYSALAWNVVRRYQNLWNIELIARPIFLGGVMQATGNKPPAMLPPRAKMQNEDMARNVALYDVPMLPTPNNFFTEVARTVLQCQRVLVAAENLQKDGAQIDMYALIDSFTEGVHLDKSARDEKNDLKIDDDFLRWRCEKAGLSSDVVSQLLDARSSKAVKEALQKNTMDAVEAGAYGAPFMRITGGKPPFDNTFTIFGSDRFEQIAHICDKTWYGPQPTRHPDASSKL